MLVDQMVVFLFRNVKLIQVRQPVVKCASKFWGLNKKMRKYFLCVMTLFPSQKVKNQEDLVCLGTYCMSQHKDQKKTPYYLFEAICLVE